MIFVKERIEVIAAQLKKFRIAQSFQLEQWQMKEGFWLRPEEAEADPTPFTDFDSKQMHWYGPDRHYWFRTQFTVPENFDGKQMWLHLRTQMEGWDARNPQFLVFVNGQVKQGADTNHQELLLADSAKAGDVYTIDLQAYLEEIDSENRSQN